MADTWIIVAVAILFPLFGAAVFFYWRIQYGVGVPWLTGRRDRNSAGDGANEVIVTRFDGSTDAERSQAAAGDAAAPRRQ
ncbi:MAG: hypothetical protein K2X32_08535 [Phycisphaerales bacterium]|nr:hypothetical protein [Phycisphaerales bacterium]